MWSVSLAWATLLFAEAAAPPAADVHAGPSPDSVAVVRAARSAQADFERMRRANLPRDAGGGSGGRCDARIGRFCYWYDPEDRAQPAESPRVRAARAQLIAHLETAADRLPGDDWVAGQRVRYLVEDGRPDAADAAARACAGTRWWCYALRGYARHAAGRAPEAEAAFDSALIAMPRHDRCQWRDLSVLLDGAAADRYHRLDCADRDTLEQRIWWLARPLQMRAGDDHRAEYLARLVMARMLEHARTTEALAWGDDARELLVRYGWPTWWTVDFAAPLGSSAGPAIIGHEPAPSFVFVPRARALEAPLASAADDWVLRPSEPARSRYAPAYATAFGPLEEQLALFRRGDSMLVVGAARVRDDSIPATDTLDVALVVSDGRPDHAVVVRSADPRRAFVLRAATRWGPALVSLEMLAPRARRAARVRRAVAPSTAGGVLALSDILLLEPDPTGARLPSTLDEATDRALGSVRLTAGRSVGLYWELYGASADTQHVTYSLAAVRTTEPWYRRAAEALGVARARPPARLEWEEVPAGTAGLAARAVRLDLADLRPGRYRLELRVTRGVDQWATTTRDIEIVAP